MQKVKAIIDPVIVTSLGPFIVPEIEPVPQGPSKDQVKPQVESQIEAHKQGRPRFSDRDKNGDDGLRLPISLDGQLILALILYQGTN
ncbi:MAG: hypothetical protein EZS28_004731 [Streblomastix strix]|uniref:Uncharacterized protein n=1 Tax=Streblomastix strix TaxID=222440 RepID=A0A5J4WZ02_9EUKA|nr:MAG: hypothetical protein EZS28_004731 [Streblomastix strix]